MKRKTFLAVSPESEIKDDHLNVIISDPDIDNTVMVVNVTTFYNTGREDRSCMIEAGEHSFIKHRSYIPYNYAKEINCIKLLNEKLKIKYYLKKMYPLNYYKKFRKGQKKLNGYLYYSRNISINSK